LYSLYSFASQLHNNPITACIAIGAYLLSVL
jgi:hypothetical protein